jgi:hypothetical protein
VGKKGPFLKLIKRPEGGIPIPGVFIEKQRDYPAPL